MAVMAMLPPSFFRNGTLLSAGLLGLVVLALLPPLVSPAMADVLMAAFAPVCHQLPGRSLHFDGTSLAVCHRCFGAYAGFFAGSVAFLASSGQVMPRLGPLFLLAVAAIPGMVDWAGDILGFWTNSPASRTATGGWFGILAGLLLASAVLDQKIRTDRNTVVDQKKRQ